MLKNKKTFKVTLFLLCTVIVILGIFIALLKWNSSYIVPQTKVSVELIDKVRKVQKEGGKLELSSEELNQMMSMYFRGQKTSGNLVVKGVKGDLVKENIELNMPVSYKGINLFVSSKGILSLKDKKIVYSPEKIALGKITLPKTHVLNKIKSYNKKGVSVENEQIYFDKSLIPLNIKSIETKNSKVEIYIDKSANRLEEKIKGIDKKIEEKIKNKKDALNNELKDPSKNNNEGKLNSGSENPKYSSDMEEALSRISLSLASASGSVSTAAQKEVISQMVSAANNMKENPKVDPYEAGASARSSYKNLSPQEKDELKSAVFSNVDGQDINIVSKMIQ